MPDPARRAERVEEIRRKFYTTFPNPEVLSGETATAIRDLLAELAERDAALARLRELVVTAEGCPVPQGICQCPSSDDCILGELLATPAAPTSRSASEEAIASTDDARARAEVKCFCGREWHCSCVERTEVRDGVCQSCRKVIHGCD